MPILYVVSRIYGEKLDKYFTNSNPYTIPCERRSYDGPTTEGRGVKPGEVLPADRTVTINEGRQLATIAVENTGDRPVQVGSHFHFFEVNPALTFDREAAYGMRLDVPAGTAIRFEPGDRQEVNLVAIGGDQQVFGMHNLVNGDLDEEREDALERAREGDFGGIE